MLASMAEREHLRTSILLVQRYDFYAKFPRKSLKIVKFFREKSARFSRRLCLCYMQTLEGARPKGAPLLCRVGSDDVQTMHARRAERHEQYTGGRKSVNSC